MSQNESTLIKPFRERDVQRVRNLANRKFGDKTVQQVGYKKEEQSHKEGDIWLENHKTWTIHNGIKQTVTKLDSLKKILQLPLICPKCSCAMKKGKLDKQMFFLHKMCFDCVIDYETELKRDGKFEEYEKNILQNNVGGFLSDLEIDFMEFLTSKSNESFVTEQGDIETWKGGDINYEDITKKFQEYISSVKDNMGL